MSTASAVVPLSYKQTEIGVIPEDWGVVSLVDIVDSSRSIRYGIVQPGKYDMHGRYMIRGQDYSLVKGWASPDEFFRVTPEVEIPYKNARVKTGDLIMTIVGYCGHVEEIPEWLDGANLTQTTARIAILPRKADSRFCKYVIQSEIGLKQVGYFIKGAAQPGLNCGDVEKFRIPLPSVHEQRKISHQIFTIDQFIGSIQQLIEKKRDIKQSAMQELLTGKTRLPGFNDEWQMKVLGDVGKVRMCKRIFNHETNTSGGVPFYKIGTFGKAADAYISQDLYDSYRTKFAFPDFGSILISAAGTIGRTVIYRGEDAYFQDSNIIWIENSENLISNHFLYHLLKVVNYTTEGGTIQRLYNSIVLNTAFTCPPKLEQEAIAEILSDMDAEIAALEERLEKAKAIKQGMMQQLLTGKIRLVEPQTSQEVSA